MVSTADKQASAGSLNPYERLQKLHDLLDVEDREDQHRQADQRRCQEADGAAQKEYYLNEKIKAINEELGRKDDRADEIKPSCKQRSRRRAPVMPKEAKEKAPNRSSSGWSPCRRSPPRPRSRATTSTGWSGVPWKKTEPRAVGTSRAEKISNDDHYGLEKIKERIVEFLAVRQLTKKTQTSIICFVGPPGVGKSSLAKSIARPPAASSSACRLGGVRDEAEIRGHRRTYIGAFPGSDHPDDEEGRHGESGLPARRDRQDVHGLSGRSGLRRCSRFSIRSRTTPSSGSLPRRRIRPLEGDVHRYANVSTPFRRRSETAWR